MGCPDPCFCPIVTETESIATTPFKKEGAFFFWCFECFSSPPITSAVHPPKPSRGVGRGERERERERERASINTMEAFVCFLDPPSQPKRITSFAPLPMFAARTASFVLVPVTTAAGYVTYVRATAKPTQAYSNIMTSKAGADHTHQWRKLNNGLGLVDVGRSCGGL
ncbi:hypothetical protein BX666DRAFT_1946760 [Dichotomocladium elegans]|nr:hypothetical protein BX666DRAFT_1946760 [Dichotomocladium elegans]